MILSASRRTDIPAFYSAWFFNRVKEGFVYVRNPMNPRRISKIPINPNVVDCIVFWTKDPSAMLPRLDELRNFHHYFQFTINPYDQRIETFVSKKEHIIDTFKRLSDKIGSNRVVWRYDPILLTADIDLDYHVNYFEAIAKRLSSYTNRCVISFIDRYKKTERNMKLLSVKELNVGEMQSVSNAISPIARAYNIEIQSCAEKIDLQGAGIRHGRCIDDTLIEDLLGCRIATKKDKNQRKECGCIESIDIGEYNTCMHNCLYCYANHDHCEVLKKAGNHDVRSPFLIGNVTPTDTISERKCASLKKQDLFGLR